MFAKWNWFFSWLLRRCDFQLHPQIAAMAKPTMGHSPGWVRMFSFCFNEKMILLFNISASMSPTDLEDRVVLKPLCAAFMRPEFVQFLGRCRWMNRLHHALQGLQYVYPAWCGCDSCWTYFLWLYFETKLQYWFFPFKWWHQTLQSGSRYMRGKLANEPTNTKDKWIPIIFVWQ